MFKRKFTTVTQLHEKNNKNIINYIESARGTYAQALRKTFYVVKNSSDFDKSSYNTHLQETYGILKRTANSIIADAQGRFNALKELKAYEHTFSIVVKWFVITFFVWKMTNAYLVIFFKHFFASF